MRLLLDEDSGAHSLLTALRNGGHDVERVVDVPSLGMGASDDAVFQYAVTDNRVLISKNGADFIDIATRPGAPRHHGVLVIHYGEGGASLPIATVARAVANIEKTYRTTTALFLDVNHHVW